jgi:hypothetical protein
MNDQSRFTLERDGDSCWLVSDAGNFIGGIDHIGEHEFLATYVRDPMPFGPVPTGPHRTLEAAFEAFTSVLGE